MVGQDEMIRRELLRAASQLEEPSVACTVDDGHVILEGVVSSDERSYQLEAAARGMAGVRSVVNGLMVEGFSATVDNVVEGVDLTPDFTAEVGTADPFESVSEADPYTPPTDPVVKADRSTDGVAIINGFAETADEAASLSGLPGAPRGDDEIREAVLAALLSDAGTTDLTVEVDVQDGVVYLRGVVPSLEDADLAESVAAGAPGVEEVQEELQVEGM
ncbi:MAG: BON domain-containing protein [Chloroflexota bacterium]